jgi:hypothetical protein
MNKYGKQSIIVWCLFGILIFSTVGIPAFAGVNL